jgi:hypothetical protein
VTPSYLDYLTIVGAIVVAGVIVLIGWSIVRRSRAS